MTAYNHSSGYTYGTDAVPTSPLTLEDLRQIEAAAHVQPGDAELLSRAEPILAPHAMEMVDTWRGILAQKTYLAAHSAHPDGQPNPEYAQASKPRFAQWIIDMCTRERDQAWLDYQYLIGARHMSAAKNAADGADSTPFVPLRYVLAFIAPADPAPRRQVTLRAIRLSAVCDAHDRHNEDVVFDGVDDPVVADTDAPRVLRARELLDPVGAGRTGERFNGIEQACAYRAIELADLARRRRGEFDAVHR